MKNEIFALASLLLENRRAVMFDLFSKASSKTSGMFIDIWVLLSMGGDINMHSKRIVDQLSHFSLFLSATVGMAMVIWISRC